MQIEKPWLQEKSHLLWEALSPFRSPVLITSLSLFTTLYTTENCECMCSFLFYVGLFHSAIRSLRTKALCTFSVLYFVHMGHSVSIGLRHKHPRSTSWLWNNCKIVLQFFLGLQKDYGQGQQRGERKGQGSESFCSQHFVHNRHGSKNLSGNWGQNRTCHQRGRKWFWERKPWDVLDS